MGRDSIDQVWEEFLSPEVLRGKLITASLYLAAYEMLKNGIIGRLKDFYTFGFDGQGERIDPRYKHEVLGRSPSVLYASLSWLRERGAIGQDDFAKFEELKECRNRIAHDMLSLVITGADFGHLRLLSDLFALLKKVEAWWIVNVEIPTSEDFAGVEIDEEGIIPGSVMTVKMMLDIALGYEAEATAYLKAFREQRRGPTAPPSDQHE